VHTNVEIRQASSGEIDALLVLLQECIEGMRCKGIDQWDDVYPGRATVVRDVEEATVFIATIRDIPVGMAVLNDHQAPEYADVPWSYGGRPAVIHRLMVSPTAEGTGIARALMTHLEGRAKALGFDCVRLDAFIQNPRAVRFYDRVDYRRAGQVRFRKGEFHCYEKRL
jgi:GNAT superfamily N-acetyltransferase